MLPMRSGGGASASAEKGVDFLRAEQSTKLKLVWGIAQSWNLKASNSRGPPSVSSEELLFSEVFARAMRGAAERRRLEGMVTRFQKRWEKVQQEKASWDAEKENLRCQLEEAQVRAEVEAVASAERAARAEQRGQQRGQEETRGFFRKVLVSLAAEFSDNDYYEAYLRYVEERPRTEAKGSDPEEVEFLPPGDDEAGPLEAAGDA